MCKVHYIISCLLSWRGRGEGESKRDKKDDREIEREIVE